jgi:hypothetical protein
MKKKIFAILSASALIFAPAAFAYPTNSNNSQIVANYTSGDHGIPGETATHTGSDVVKLNGHSGNLNQWFYGTSTENGGITEGDHSVWKNIGTSTNCPNGTLIVNAYPAWGYYLQPGANYCVKTNDFNNH